jgi:hypothetical protein
VHPVLGIVFGILATDTAKNENMLVGYKIEHLPNIPSKKFFLFSNTVVYAHF